MIKNYIIAILTIFLTTSISLSGLQGIKWESVEDGFKTAANGDKTILLYVHAEWCPWCKKMESEVYSDNSVKTYITENFVTVRLDIESEREITLNGKSMSEREYAASLGVRNFPTSIFLSPDGNPILVAPGFMPAETYLKLLRYVEEEHYQVMEWNQFKNSGP